MIKRQLKSEILSAAKDYPVVTVRGARQTGKTTLTQMAFPDYRVVNLENPELRAFAKEDPQGFLRIYAERVIFDEVQRVPELLSHIQVLVDKTKQKGQFVLTGSHQFQLMENVTQSLAGRTAILDLFPLSFAELGKLTPQADAEDYLFKGFMPQIHAESIANVTRYYRNYFLTYVERDVRLISQIHNLIQFEKFLRLCAGRIGQLLDLSSLGNDVGVDGKTIHHWLSILEASYIIRRLPPFFENMGKRLIKSAKLYFCDVGLASYLLGIESKEQLVTHPLKGHLFENMVVMELLKSRANKGLASNLFFYRDQNKNEVDVVFQRGHQLVPIEVKSTETFSPSLVDGLKVFAKYLGKRSIQPALILGGLPPGPIYKDVSLYNFHEAEMALK